MVFVWGGFLDYFGCSFLFFGFRDLGFCVQGRRDVVIQKDTSFWVDRVGFQVIGLVIVDILVFFFSRFKMYIIMF